MGETQDLVTAGPKTERRPGHGSEVFSIDKMPDAQRFSAVSGRQRAYELVAVARGVVSERRARMPVVPMDNVRGVGAAVEAGRRWAMDERGTQAPCEIYVFSPGNAGGRRARDAAPPSGHQLPARKVPG